MKNSKCSRKLYEFANIIFVFAFDSHIHRTPFFPQLRFFQAPFFHPHIYILTVDSHLTISWTCLISVFFQENVSIWPLHHGFEFALFHWIGNADVNGGSCHYVWIRNISIWCLCWCKSKWRNFSGTAKKNWSKH